MTRHSPDIPPATRALLACAVAWTLAWKGASLWRAAKNDDKPWFVTLLLANTLGILDAVYLFGIDRARGRAARRTATEVDLLSVKDEPEHAP